MYKLIIVDDEEHVREAIRILGKWKDYNITEIYEANNGREAIDIIIKNKPNIALVDMKMPKMNGVELLKKIESKNLGLFSIVISGYSDFEYAKQAIKSNSIDYILKPINGDELNKVLFKAIGKIKETNSKRIDKIDKNIKLNVSIPTLKERFYMSIIEGGYNKNYVSNYGEVINPIGFFQVALIKLNDYSSILEKMFTNDINLMYFAVTNVINELSLYNIDCFAFRNQKVDGEIVVIMNSRSNEKFDISGIKSICICIHRKLYELFGINSISSIGGNCGQVPCIYNSYKSARKVFEHVNLINYKTVNTEKYLMNKEDNISIINNFSIIKNVFENKAKIQFLNIFRDFFSSIEKRGYFSFLESYKIIEELDLILKEIVNDLKNRNKLCDEKIYNGFFKSEHRDYGNFNNYVKFVLYILDDFYNKFSTLDSEKKFSVKDIKKFIEGNYFKDIKISFFTEKYFLSREYIMKLFKKEFGYGIYEYVKIVRMRKAEELLTDINIKISSISRMVGYNDQNYFSKVFKGFYGISPSEFRIKLELNKQT